VGTRHRGLVNWISPCEVLVGSETRGTPAMEMRTRRFGRGCPPARRADCRGPRPAHPSRPRGLLDNNVYLRDERIVAVTDFEFLGRRPRIDDLALLLYFADEQPYFVGAGFRDQRTRRTELTPLVHAYARQLATPLTEAEITGLPITLAPQPLWTYGTRLVADLDDHHAAAMRSPPLPAVTRALEIADEPEPWAHAFSRT
jgi:hypothetical protein